MSISCKRLAGATVLALVVFALGRAASFRFRQVEDAFRQACTVELQKLGIPRDAAKKKYPTPYIASVSNACLLPGGTAEVVVRGKFVPGTKFIFQNDNLEVVKESLVGEEYRATLKAAGISGPQSANLMVITPVTCIAVRQENVASIGGTYEWNMDAANGWKIVARPVDSKPCAAPSSAGDRYEVLFYRAGESTPFEKREASLLFSLWDRANYQFMVSEAGADGQAGMRDAATLMQKLSDPKLSDAQREQIMTQLMKMQEKMQADMARMADPAYAKQQEEKRQQFGCERIFLEVPAGSGTYSGRMRCAPKVGTDIKLTGSLRLIKR